VTRLLYRGLVALHPSSFQDKFGEELLWIYDLKDSEYSSFVLLFDCFLSLVRQWLFHSSIWMFGVSFLINCFVFQKMIEFFVLDLRRLLASFL
jgi:hypothetical protein